MMHSVPIPKEERYRITCTTFNNGTQEFTAEYLKGTYEEKEWYLLFFHEKITTEQWEHCESKYLTDYSLFPVGKKYSTREEALKAIDKHHGEKVSKISVEIIIK